MHATQVANATALLRTALVGSFISRFSVGDTWSLDFGGCWLVAQEIIAEDEDLVSQYVQATTDWYAGAVDREYVAKAAFVAGCMRKVVSSVELDEACVVRLSFEDGSQLVIPASADLVDWQWALSQTDSDPYTAYEVACFWAGEIELNAPGF